MPSSAFKKELFRSDRKSTRLNSSHLVISYHVFCLKKKNAVSASGSYIVGGVVSLDFLQPLKVLRLLVCPYGLRVPVVHFFFFNDTATTEIYTLSLHDALPI